MKILNTVYVIVFVALLILPIVLLEATPGAVSQIDNRRLLDMPVLGSDGFTDKYESYLKDRIGGRRMMISHFQKLSSLLLGCLEHPLYISGKDGHIFNNINECHFGDYHRLFAESVAKISRYCEERNVPFYLIFNPDKNSVYSRFLPDGVARDNSWVDSLFAYMDRLGVKYVNNTKLLADLSYSENVFNSRYDVGHWNDNGAFHGTNALLELVNKDFPSVKPVDVSAYKIVSVSEPCLVNSDFVINDEVPNYIMKSCHVEERDWFDEVRINQSFRYFHHKMNKSEEAATLPVAMIFHGSYYNRKPDFWFPCFREYVGIHNYQNIFDIDYYFNIFRPDLVILDLAEYVVKDVYFSQNTMENLCLNPAIGANELEKSSIKMPIDAHSKLFVGKALDNLFVNIDIRSAKYAYLTLGDKVYDLRCLSDGSYSLSLPRGTICDTIASVVYAVDEAGAVYSFRNKIYNLESVAPVLYHSPNVSVENGNIFTFETDYPGNKFNAFNLQLIDSNGQFLTQMLVSYGESIKNLVYHHDKESGKYFIRAKANSSLKDESVDMLVYLIAGENYLISFDSDIFSDSKIKVSNFEMWGKTEVLNYKLLEISGMSERTSPPVDGYLKFSTDIPDNKFNSCVVQLYDKNGEDVLASIDMSSAQTINNIQYTHGLDSGDYIVRLRANSNLHDEYADYKVFFEKGNTYNLSYDLQLLSDREVVAGKFMIVYPND